ncbi:ABC transporter substrate-binding protein [Ruania halotolerans]|uniref:ABC transporter substrate-binding protein n=1 Tax=Ruania halotolerans TaxID=2897773 RepID=UPI001E5885E2|nr:extracellular solute-binding protein [Ruania halotolerans]UFU06980.1 extracellular solute-binding protein [Ruania halotolerans]
MRARRKTLISGAAAAALLTVSLAACGSGGGSDDSGTTLTYWRLSETNEATGAAFAEVLEQFEADNPGVTIQVEERSTDGHKEALRTALGTSGAPDIYWSWAGPGIGGDFVNNGGSLDLAEYYEEYGWASRFNDVSMSSITQYGGYDGIPSGYSGAGIYYNKQLFADAGITETPETYEELLAAADALKASGTDAIEFGGTVNWHLMRLLDNLLETECGADTFDALVRTEASWADESCVETAFSEFSTWSQDYLIADWASLDDAQANQLLFSGQAAMVIEGSWFPQVLVNNNVDPDDFGVFRFPTGTDRLYGDTSNNYVSATTEHPDEAAAFLDHLTSTDSQTTLSQASGSRSVNVEVPLDTEGGTALDATWGEIFESSEGLYAFNDQNLTLAQTTEYFRILNAVASGDIAAADAGPQFQSFIDQQS